MGRVMQFSVLSGIVISGGIALGSGGAAQAATFLPDMWVYEVSVSGSAPASFPVYASTTADVGTPAPEGCTSGPDSDPSGAEGPPTYMFVSCDNVQSTDLGIDLQEAIDADPVTSYTAKIGFNESGFVCSGTMVSCSLGAPSSSVFINALDFDYASGVAYLDGAAFKIFSDGTVGERFTLSPTNVSMSGYLARFYADEWDYGRGGGSWTTIDSVLVGLSGGGTLIQSPTVVPLPAAGWMLLAGIGGMVALKRRARD